MVKEAAIALAGVLARGPAPAANAQAAETAAGTTVINKDDAPIRTGPGWNHDLITYGKKGDTFNWECYSIGSDWTSIWLYERLPGSPPGSRSRQSPTRSGPQLLATNVSTS